MASAGGQGSPASGLSLHQLSRLLTLFRSDAAGNNADEDNDEEDEGTTGRRPRRAPRTQPSWWMTPHAEPQPKGLQLLHGGEFGRISPKEKSSTSAHGTNKYVKNVSRTLLDRRMRIRPTASEDISESLVPNSHGTIVASYPANVYCGQFSTDSSFYYVCCKDFNLHLYDMTSPRSYGKHNMMDIMYDATTGHRTSMKVMKSIRGIAEGWTITDSHLSPDNEHMIYSSMNSTVFMVKTMEMGNQQKPICFSETRARSHSLWGWDDDSYCIWSCRFSADGNEVIAGGRGKIFVYDLIADRRTVKISAHQDDVNSCCWADSGSNVLISASDDTFIKVWDRRSLGSSTRPSGVLIGHTEGITNVSAKGDGRYVISNGKDQALRLWDLRKMRSDDEYQKVKTKTYGLEDFDYRYQDDRWQPKEAHPKDCSVMTYRGHSVMRTLIRCHFSPAETTGGAYVYSGSSDGRIHIWSLDGRRVQVLDRSRTAPMGVDPSAPDPASSASPSANFSSCVRDVSWHSREPVLMSAAWSARGHSTVARHEWKGLNKMGGKLEDWVAKQQAESMESEARRNTRGFRNLPGSFHRTFDDEEDY
ncbi:WD40 repeat-like protein [Schizopora paradoxa]|uniref:WD40 repeat-like protein n=1 Tax=Schizopora paradoxa TaxID=27342 RepID=A0A0H2R0I1_9AGAM|nr:WD40 repeat-like protein [Schizopora paradoxa]